MGTTMNTPTEGQPEVCPFFEIDRFWSEVFRSQGDSFEDHDEDVRRAARYMVFRATRVLMAQRVKKVTPALFVAAMKKAYAEWDAELVAIMAEQDGVVQ